LWEDDPFDDDQLTGVVAVSAFNAPDPVVFGLSRMYLLMAVE
jgi:hypothetical protein